MKNMNQSFRLLLAGKREWEPLSKGLKRNKTRMLTFSGPAAVQFIVFGQFKLGLVHNAKRIGLHCGMVRNGPHFLAQHHSSGGPAKIC
jgi:hypothetical protein